MDMRQIEKRKESFRLFLLSRNPSERFARTYFSYLNGTLVKEVCQSVAKCDNIFMVSCETTVQDIYQVVKASPRNIANHNVYSGAVSAYAKYLIGKPLRKRVEKTILTSKG